MPSLLKCVAVLAAVCVAVAFATPLDDYVNKPDATYKWETVNSVRGDNFTAYNIKLTSQTWMDPTLVSISVWTHWLQICIPDDVRNSPFSRLLSSSLVSCMMLSIPLCKCVLWYPYAIFFGAGQD